MLFLCLRMALLCIFMDQFLWQSFVTLLVVVDPFLVIPAFLALTRNDTVINKRKTATKACLIGAAILVIFAFLGDKLLDVMSISEPAFRIAGGFLLLLVAIDMVVAKSHSGLVSTTGDEEEEALHREDVSVFPLAIPLIAGPGALTSIVVLMRQAETLSSAMPLYVIGIALVVIGMTYICLLMSEYLMKILGITGNNVLTRVFGIILAALAVQGMIHGITAVGKSIVLGA